MSKVTLGELIEWLKSQPHEMVVKDGFSLPHTDRGYYCDLAFEPEEETTIGEMLKHAVSALGETFCGYKGGEYKMDSLTECHIGEWGECGEPITKTHFKYWLLNQ